MLRTILPALLLLSPFEAWADDRWQPAADADTMAVVNCLIDHWLQDGDFARAATRYELHLKLVSEALGPRGYAAPKPHERRPVKQTRRGRFFCMKGRQTDYSSLLFRDGELTLSNGKSVENGQIDGFAYGVMPVYGDGQSLEIYVQSGSWSSRRMKSGENCIYDATSGADRLYFQQKSISLSFIGEANIWVADAVLPNCMREFTPEYFAGSPQTESRLTHHAK